MGIGSERQLDLFKSHFGMCNLIHLGAARPQALLSRR